MIGNLIRNTVQGGGSQTFTGPGDGNSYTESANGWYTDWTPPALVASIICNGAGGGGGGAEQGINAQGGNGGSGGYSALATAAIPSVLLYQARGGAGGNGEVTDPEGSTEIDPEDGDAGSKSTDIGLSLAVVSYRVFVGRGGGPGLLNTGNGTNYTTGTGGTAGAGAAGGDSAFNNETFTNGSAGSNGSVVVTW